MVIQSGSDKHRLRRFHQILANIKYLTHPDRAEELALYYNVGYVDFDCSKLSMTPFLQMIDDACVETIQEWFIAVLVIQIRCIPSRAQFLSRLRSLMKS